MVTIKDMKMPDCCFHCRLMYETKDDYGESSGYNYCIFNTHERLSLEDLFEQRASTCPLSEVLENDDCR